MQDRLTTAVDEPLATPGEERGFIASWRPADTQGVLASFALHALLLFLLAFIIISGPRGEPVSELLVARLTGSPEGDVDLADTRITTRDAPNEEQAVVVNVIETAMARPVEMNVNEVDVRVAVDPSDVMSSRVDVAVHLAGRTKAVRAALAAAGGGNDDSELAVENGLKWIARHQRSNGSWNFQHGSDDPGMFGSCTTGATGMALLAFLGAGYTQEQPGEYQRTVRRGLDYLMESGTPIGDFRGKTDAREGMYSQGLSGLALCEAYGLTKDPRIRRSAQAAVDFIVKAQDPVGGGWRYEPREPGDTSVTGWQLMVLKSAELSKLKVPTKCLDKAAAFLNSVQRDSGARYAYQVREPDRPPMTAIGLLCRMYMGWTPKKMALERGVEHLAEVGPARDDIYFNYYATQVVHHWGGAPWQQWNGVMRNRLVETQVKSGDSAGSWHPTGGPGSVEGGRLYETCLSVMTLEVYYRYLPLYQRSNVTTGF